MCGIAGYIGNKKASRILCKALKRLEYRGYDSVGIATFASPGIQVRKGVGEIDEIKRKLKLNDLEGLMGIGHTRWATHGNVDKANAHPHLDCASNLAIVHNGMIENWKELKKKLSGHEFRSQTDSEVIAHFLEEESNGSLEKAIQKFLKVAKGNFAVIILSEGKLYACKRGSPLALGIASEEIFLGSDAYSFSPFTDKSIFFEDNEYAVINGFNFIFKNAKGGRKNKKIKKLDKAERKARKQKFKHWMHKEINEIPSALKRLNYSLANEQKERLDKLFKLIKSCKKVLITASGTSYHASLLGIYWLIRAGLDAQALIASEFANYERVDNETLLIAISQSGETRDVLDSIDFSKEKGAKVASIVNVPYSTIERKSDLSLQIEAGQEVCVAATKSFTNQVYLLAKLAKKLGLEIDLTKIPKVTREAIQKNENTIKKFAKELADKKDIYVIGRDISYPIAREIALKLKEIAYIHAEGMMGGELKHGTLALIKKGTPVISLIPSKDSGIYSNVKEVEARGARSLRISPYYGQFKIPQKGFPFTASILGFLLSYWIARTKGLPVDKPRNLAKSVTVK